MIQMQNFAKQSPENPTGDNFQYLILSFISGILETGILTCGLMLFDITIGLALALVYQIGCLVRNPLRLSLQGSACALCCAVILFQFSDDRLGLLLLATFFLSGGVQSTREWLLIKHNQVSLHIKRLIRVSGFITGILGYFMIGSNLLVYTSIVAVLVVLPVVFTQKCSSPFINLNKRWEPSGYGWIMLLHQTHYFAYAYVLLAFFLSRQNQSSIEPLYWKYIIASAWFALGWCSYISGKWLLKNTLKMSAIKAVVFGHGWVVLCLALMVIFKDFPFVVGLSWVLGGFGGGSVYAIKDLAEENSCKADLELWEHWGHVLGVFASFLLVKMLPLCTVAPFFLAMIAALATLVLVGRSYYSSELVG